MSRQAFRSVDVSLGSLVLPRRTALLHRARRPAGSSRIPALRLDFPVRYFDVPAPIEQLLVRPEEYASEGSLVSYIPSFLSRQQSDDLFIFLRDSVAWRREIDDFGPQDRKSYYWADESCTFSYVGLKLKPNPWPEPVLRTRDQISAYFTSTGFPALTGCLANNYKEGQGSIVWHCDEVRAHGPMPLIVSLTLSPGGSRPFKLKHKEEGTEMTQELEHGSLLVMSGNCQKHWLHCLPLETPAPHRISLTFRSIVPGFEDGQGDNGRMRDCLD